MNPANIQIKSPSPYPLPPGARETRILNRILVPSPSRGEGQNEGD